jgi:hypothetical protein
LPVVDGAIHAPPSTEYEIHVRVAASGSSGGHRVVRASVDGAEVNEQLILAPGCTSGKFVGWLEGGDLSGSKRIHFTFPRGETIVQVCEHSHRPWPHIMPCPHLRRCVCLLAHAGGGLHRDRGRGGQGGQSSACPTSRASLRNGCDLPRPSC